MKKRSLNKIAKKVDKAMDVMRELSDSLKEKPYFIESIYIVNKSLHDLWKIQKEVESLIETPDEGRMR